MSRASWLNYVYLANFSQPQSDRQLYRLVKRHRVGKIIELGIEDLERTWRMLAVAARYGACDMVKYAALDSFEARGSGVPRLSLIEAYRTLQATAATVRLLPGCPTETLSGVANSHMDTDLVLIASWITDQQLTSAWTWMPRMLHEQSVVVRTVAGGDSTREQRLLTPEEVSRLAESATPRAAA